MIDRKSNYDFIMFLTSNMILMRSVSIWVLSDSRHDSRERWTIRNEKKNICISSIYSTFTFHTNLTGSNTGTSVLWIAYRNNVFHDGINRVRITCSPTITSQRCLWCISTTYIFICTSQRAKNKRFLTSECFVIWDVLERVALKNSTLAM